MAIPGQVTWAEKADIYSWFETGDFPTEAQFRATWDSYFHKSDKIAMGNISGLVEALNKTVSLTVFNSHLNDTNAHSSYLAKLDASNLSAQHVNIWKDKLGVGTLPPNVATIDYQTESGFILEGNAYKKLAIPQDGKTYVLGIDGKAVDASNIGGGKVDKVMNVTPDANKNVDISGINVNWTGQHRYSMLINKRNDATYTRLIGADSSGNMAEVGYVAIKSTFSGFTPAQALELGQLLNGGTGSAGAMSVNLISPPIIHRIDSTEYVLLRGANLNLNAVSKRIDIINSTTKAIIATIPDNQIQLYPDGLSLIFYFNFKNMPAGNYLLRLTSDVKVYETTLELKVVNEVNNVIVDNLSWEIAYDPSVVPSTSNLAVGRNVFLDTPFKADGTMNGLKPRVCAKSEEIFPQGTDFYLEIKVNISTRPNSGVDANRSYIGLGYSATQNVLANTALVNYNYLWTSFDLIATHNNDMRVVDTYSVDTTVVFIKTGNLFRTIVGTVNHMQTLSNNSGYSLFLNIVGRVGKQSQQIQIIKAYTFN